MTRHPTAEWLAQQIVEAFPWETAPTYLVRDNDGAYGPVFTRRVRAMGIRDRPISSRSPWQNPYAERLIGTLRRDCLDHVLVFDARHLQRILTAYTHYYNQTPPIVGQGCSARPSDPAAWSHHHCADFVRTASLLRADMIFGRHRCQLQGAKILVGGGKSAASAAKTSPPGRYAAAPACRSERSYHELLNRSAEQATALRDFDPANVAFGSRAAVTMPAGPRTVCPQMRTRRCSAANWRRVPKSAVFTVCAA